MGRRLVRTHSAFVTVRNGRWRREEPRASAFALRIETEPALGQYVRLITERQGLTSGHPQSLQPGGEDCVPESVAIDDDTWRRRRRAETGRTTQRTAQPRGR